MITEKTIEKHRYFTTGNGDMWILASVETVKVVQLHRIDRDGPRDAADVADITLGGERCGRFTPVKLPPGARDAAAEPPVEDKSNSRRRATASRSEGMVKSLSPLPASGYRGVHIRNTRKFGARFVATCTENGKTVRIGVFDREELAAAARAERLGDPDEAARLRKLAEQKAAIDKITVDGGPVTYDCDGCGENYESRPGECEKCMGRSFSEIPASAQARAESYVAGHAINCGAK